ncbi:MAG: hypothetical protein WBL63_24020 [Candidatus Acidiferrum sp.]
MLLKSVGANLVLLTAIAVVGLAFPQSQPTPKVAGNLEILGFVLGKSTLADVEAKLGKSVARKCSRDEEASKEVCYLSAGKDATKVVFEAGFSGGWQELDGFKVIAGGVERPCYRQCPTASQVTRDVQTEAGLKLGVTREQLISLLGTPKQVRGNLLSFQWQSRQAMTKEQTEAASRTFKSPVTDPYYDVQDTVEVILADSKVVEVEVHHIVTN